MPPRVRRTPAPSALAAFVSSFDRFAIKPLIVLVTHDLRAAFAEALTIGSAYFLAYGISYSDWGALPDRLGRIRLIKVKHLAEAAARVVATFAD